MTDRIESIRARHAARLRTRVPEPARRKPLLWKVDDDVAALLAEVERLQASVDDFNEEIANCEVLEYKAQVQRVKDLAKAWSDPAWSGHATAATFVRAINTALTPGSIEDRLRAVLAPVAPDAEPGEPRD